MNWILKGARIDYKCDGSPQRHVEVVKDDLAWNETEPGKGGTPAPMAANERALFIWTLPAGAIKMANAAGAALKITMENGKTVLNYPVASLGADYLSDVMFPKRIVQKRGGMTVMDLTLTKTNTYNPYMILPVQDTLKAASR